MSPGEHGHDLVGDNVGLGAVSVFRVIPATADARCFVPPGISPNLSRVALRRFVENGTKRQPPLRARSAGAVSCPVPARNLQPYPPTGVVRTVAHEHSRAAPSA